ncbi:MAG: glycosyltransferase, partial [Candidatus Methanomethylicaceae archaeon]
MALRQKELIGVPMVNRELVSVVIPTFNRAFTLKRTLESVLCQSYRQFEIVVVDDGSTDKTEEIAQRVADSRLRWVR